MAKIATNKKYIVILNAKHCMLSIKIVIIINIIC